MAWCAVARNAYEVRCEVTTAIASRSPTAHADGLRMACCASRSWSKRNRSCHELGDVVGKARRVLPLRGVANPWVGQQLRSANALGQQVLHVAPNQAVGATPHEQGGGGDAAELG